MAMIIQEQAEGLAREWVEAWNRHDLEGIVAHYSDSVVLSSPRVVDLLGDPEGALEGKDALRAYFDRGLKAIPDLKFELLDVLTGVDGLTIYYGNQTGRHVAEIMSLDDRGLVSRVTVHYGPG
jgi:ketosteroid isomerase-like protein